MKIGVPRETMPGEARVGLVPETVGRLAKAGNTVVVERGAGAASSFTDEAYEKAGAQLVDNAFDAELVAKVQRPTDAEVSKLHSGTVLIAFLSPLTNHALVDQLARAGVTALSMDAIPRITRAQPMDALSSQATRPSSSLRRRSRSSSRCSRPRRARSRRPRRWSSARASRVSRRSRRRGVSARWWRRSTRVRW